MEGQMSIFDFLENTPEVKWHPVIDELSKDLHEYFKNGKCRIDDKETYYTWSHVPNLEKRYTLIIYLDGEYSKTLSLSAIIDKYKKKQLDVSLSVTPFIRHDEDYDFTLYIFTIWNTKGHKEP